MAVKIAEKIVVATQNLHKLEEIQAIFRCFPETEATQLLSLKEVVDSGLVKTSDLDIEESGKTFKENALIKAKEIHRLTKIPALSDDSGLTVTLLNEPGVYSARYAGQQATDLENNRKLIEKLQKIGAWENFKKGAVGVDAYFTSVVVLYHGNSNLPFLAGEGRCFGSIIAEPRGNNGFGYDPHFVPKDNNPQSLSFAEMRGEEKNQHSHRKFALLSLIEKITHSSVS